MFVFQSEACDQRCEQKICDLWAELLSLTLYRHYQPPEPQNYLNVTFWVCTLQLSECLSIGNQREVSPEKKSEKSDGLFLPLIYKWCFFMYLWFCSDPPGRRWGPDTPWVWKTRRGAPESEIGWSGEVATVRVFSSGRSLDYWVHALLLGQAEVKKTTQELPISYRPVHQYSRMSPTVTPSVFDWCDKRLFVSAVAAWMDWTMMRLKDFRYAYSSKLRTHSGAFLGCALV